LPLLRGRGWEARLGRPGCQALRIVVGCFQIGGPLRSGGNEDFEVLAVGHALLAAVDAVEVDFGVEDLAGFDGAPGMSGMGSLM
jgi:hypothetical protein